MVKAITKYSCEICGIPYNTVQEAEQCEKKGYAKDLYYPKGLIYISNVNEQHWLCCICDLAYYDGYPHNFTVYVNAINLQMNEFNPIYRFTKFQLYLDEENRIEKKYFLNAEAITSFLTLTNFVKTMKLNPTFWNGKTATTEYEILLTMFMEH